MVLRRIKTWQLLIVFVLLIAASVYTLRQNNLGMVERRNLVKQADENNDNVQAALTELQRYVASHMNTNLGEGIFLEHSYQRAYDMAVQAAANAVNPSSQVYKDAEATCRQTYLRDRSYRNYVSCMDTQLKAATPGSDPLANLEQPPAELFTHNFASTRWSPDWAGVSVLLAVITAVLIVLRLLSYIVLRAMLKMRIKH